MFPYGTCYQILSIGIFQGLFECLTIEFFSLFSSIFFSFSLILLLLCCGFGSLHFHYFSTSVCVCFGTAVQRKIKHLLLHPFFFHTNSVTISVFFISKAEKTFKTIPKSHKSNKIQAFRLDITDEHSERWGISSILLIYEMPHFNMMLFEMFPFYSNVYDSR